MEEDDINYRRNLRFDLCVEIKLWIDDESESIPVPVLPSITKVKVRNGRTDFKSKLRSLPNMRELRIINDDESEINNLQDMHLYMGDKVESVDIRFYRDYNLSIVESLINNCPLVKLVIIQLQTNETDSGSFVEMLVNSRNNTLKTVTFWKSKDPE